jgi:hypothetical protein
MNAVQPLRRMRPLTSESRALLNGSRVLRRGVLGDKLDGRSREGRFLLKVERELIAHCGGKPSFAQRLLIRRACRAMLRLELLDEKLTGGKWSDHDAREFGGLSNSLRLTLRELGLKAQPADKAPTLDDIVRGSR